jgi:methylated-DNA-[protein]-cysteine S-methyltransferase
MKLEYLTMRNDMIGDIWIVGDENHVVDISLTEEDWLNFRQTYDVQHNEQNSILQEAKRQLNEYFSGKRKQFDLPIKFLKGTPFQQKVWKQLLQIPYGKTITYGELAAAIQQPKAVRAVGQANRKNPLAIIIPCHRVIGKDGKLTGYSGNRTDLKEKLLKLEGADCV